MPQRTHADWSVSEPDLSFFHVCDLKYTSGNLSRNVSSKESKSQVILSRGDVHLEVTL